MLRMKTNMILLAPLVMFQSIVWSQGNSNSLNRPLEFSDFVSETIEDEYFIGGDLSQLTFTSGKPWKVWCSQANTRVFQEPRTSSAASQVDPSLDFREQVIVTDIEGDWLQIKTPTSDGQPIGWVKSAYLLLSPFALKTSGGVGRKALVVPNLDRQNSEQQETRTQLYNHPNVSRQDAQKGRRAGLFRVLYVFKETDSAMLLGVTPTIEDGSAGSVILGWMPKQYLTEWNRRVAYGPAYGQFAEA